MEMSIVTEGKESSSLKSFIFSGYILVATNPFTAILMFSACKNASPYYVDICHSVTPFPGFVFNYFLTACL